MNSVALVTGGGSGLGAALSKFLASTGFDVAIHYHSSRAEAGNIAEEIQETGRRAFLYQADLTRESEIVRMKEELTREPGRLDLLVNNAGVYHEKGLLELTESDWHIELNSTASAVYFTTRALLPLLRKSKGRVINIGDSNCDHPGARSMAPAYHIGKTGVHILTRSFAAHEAENGVAVNMVSPGLLENSVGLPSPDMVPAGRFGKFEDIFAAVGFLATTETHYITGSNFIVGGGWNL